MLHKILFLLMISPFLAAEALPDLESIRFETKERHHNFQVGFEYSTLNSPTGSLNGYGFRTSWDYAINKSFAAGINFSQSFSAKSMGSFLFSELSTEAKWAPFGDLLKYEKITSLNDKILIQERTQSTKYLALGLGISQIFLNASSTVYPATGFSPFVEYNFSLGSQSYVLKANYNMLYGDKINITGIFFSVGIALDTD